MYMTTLRRVVFPFGIISCLISPAFVMPALAQQSSDRAEFPGRRIGGGTRGECVMGRQPLVALTPSNNLGVTASDRPSVYFLMPTLEETHPVEFLLRDSAENSVYETTVDVDTAEKIVGVHLPEGYLEVGQDYHWYFSIVCDPQDRSQNIVLSGWLRRVSPEMAEHQPVSDPSLDQSSFDQSRSEQAAGLSMDTIATLVELRQAHPNDNEILLQWTELLQMLELDTVVEQPLAAQF